MRYNICYLVISSMTYALALRRKIFKIKSDRHLTFLETSQLFDISMATLSQLGLKNLNPTQPVINQQQK